MKVKNRSFLSYLDDDDEKKKAIVEIIESNKVFIKFATNKNIITLPFSRIIKLKEERESEEIRKEMGENEI
jgi:hypothetical protein|tara:strand:+ start:49 stop:261 length:213 start_codon:yes stop_codon:yes gene_type:complete